MNEGNQGTGIGKMELYGRELVTLTKELSGYVAENFGNERDPEVLGGINKRVFGINQAVGYLNGSMLELIAKEGTSLSKLPEQSPSGQVYDAYVIRSIEDLTERELGVLELMKQGFSHKQIQTALTFTENTIKTHVKHIYEKLNCGKDAGARIPKVNALLMYDHYQRLKGNVFNGPITGTHYLDTEIEERESYDGKLVELTESLLKYIAENSGNESDPAVLEGIAKRVFGINQAYGYLNGRMLDLMAREGTSLSILPKQSSSDQPSLDPVYNVDGLEDIEDLTGRQREVLQLLSEGLAGKEIGEKLNIAYNTVKTHTKDIFNTLHINKSKGSPGKIAVNMFRDYQKLLQVESNDPIAEK